MLIDSHCHLSMNDFKNDLKEVIKNACDNNINGMLNISTEINEFKKVSSISNNNKNIWYSLGIHPHNVNNSFKEINTEIFKYITDKKFIAIGETGLDYYYENSKKNLQKESFIEHINIARKRDLPIIVHTRDADKDTINILRNEYEKGKFRGLIHCFTASEELAKAALSLGLYISISGIITFKNAETLRNTVKNIPLERILVETDAPYLSPVPLRGKRNEPAFVTHTAKFLAELFNISSEELNKITTNNFFNLFTKASLEE